MNVQPAPQASDIGARLQRFELPGHIYATSLVLILALSARVAESIRFPTPQCFFHTVTGLPCLTCGSTRMLIALGHADPIGAFSVQPLMTTVALGTICWTLIWSFGSITGLRCSLKISELQRRWLCVVGGIAVIANWIYLIVHKI